MNGLQDSSICFMTHNQWQKVWHMQCVCRQNSDRQTLERFTGMCVHVQNGHSLELTNHVYQVTGLRICGILFSIHPAWDEFSPFVCLSLTHTWACTHDTYSRTCACAFTRVFVHSHVCACTHTYTHTHTHLRCSIINFSSTMKSNEIRMEKWTILLSHYGQSKIISVLEGLKS
jgi:hypothetical protein